MISAILKGDVLPTGFEESLIYQIMPFIEKCIVMVLFPLNSILYEQKERLGSATYVTIKDTLIEQRKILVAKGICSNCSKAIKQF